MQASLQMRERFAFSAAHHLPTFPDDHKCRRVHGHVWDVIVDVEVGDSPDERGYVIDHARVRTLVWREIGKLDHRLLNDIEDLERGLAEDVLHWIVRTLLGGLDEIVLRLTRVELVEHSSADGHHVEHSRVWTRE